MAQFFGNDEDDDDDCAYDFVYNAQIETKGRWADETDRWPHVFTP